MTRDGKSCRNGRTSIGPEVHLCIFSSLLPKIMKEALTSSLFSTILAGLLKPKLRKMKKKLDYTEEGGAVLLGICKPIVKAHGSSNAKAFKNAIRQAADFAESHAVETITEQLQKQKEIPNA